MKKILSIMLAICIICVLRPMHVFATSEVDTIQTTYAILPGTEEWDDLGTVQNKLNVCRISDETLDKMTDKELVQAIVEFPFLIDIYLVDDYNTAVEALSKNCDALSELLTRDTAKDALLNFLNIRYKNTTKFVTGTEEYQNEAIAIILSYIPELRNTLDDKEVEIINVNSKMVQIGKSDRLGQRMAYVYTPNGTSVSCTTPTCNHASATFHSDIDASTVNTYGVTLVSPGTCRYNCHSYAWYSTSTTNGIWIDNPSVYMTDGSYSMVLSGLYTNSVAAGNGYRVCYGQSNAALHSALLASTASSVPLSNRMAISKWGTAGVYMHSVANVPNIYWDDNRNISVWD